MFEEHRAKKAAQDYQEALARWQAEHDGYAHLVAVARDFGGDRTADIVLHQGETVFYTVTGCGLVEERRGPGHYQGASSGFSVPVGHTGVRYRVGATRGHYVQGSPVATAIDRGPVVVTSARVVFLGAHQTRECDFAKLIGVTHDDRAGETTFSVANRQTPVTVHYGPALAAAFEFRLDLALAHFRGTVAQMVAELEADLARIDAARPVPPAGVTG